MFESTEKGQAGQALILFVLALVAMLALAGLVIDGGNVWSQQRIAQNGADAAAEAGTVIVAQKWMGASVPSTTGTCPASTPDSWDLAVCQATYGSAASNGFDITGAYYTDYQGTRLTSVGSGTVPATAQGVETVGQRTFGTYLARVVGINSFTAGTQATAVTGVVTAICPPNSGCGALPITIPFVVSNCDSSGFLTPGTGDWTYLGDQNTTLDNLQIVPVCKNKTDPTQIGGGSAGSVGWLDYQTAIGATITGTCGNLVSQITSPCVSQIPFPTWIQTIAGGVGKNGATVEDTINTNYGAPNSKTVQFPLFDGTCRVQPTGVTLGDCPNGQQGVGQNTWYHITTFVSFKIYAAYLSGNDKQQCGQPYGQPYVTGNGSNGCLKGWFVQAAPAPGTFNLEPIPPNNTQPLGVQLIR